MTSQVFISYSSKDKAIADTICQRLESAGIPCWMAPRDIEFGSDWTEAIMRAITACRVFVLVFSEIANVSGHVRGWALGAGVAVAAAVIMTAAAWLYIAGDRIAQPKPFSSGLLAEVSAKSVAVLPFESISSSKDDGYFADGVQDEILNNLAKIAQLKVISRTSVMQYRADTKRDMRQIADALGVANVIQPRNGELWEIKPSTKRCTCNLIYPKSI
jgi:hypothetical protein